METAWEAEQTMSLQVSYLCGGNEVGASVGESQSPVQVPETPAGSRGTGGGLVLVTVSTLLLRQSCQGSRDTESLCSGAEGSLLGAASAVTGHDQRREEEGGVHGAD